VGFSSPGVELVTVNTQDALAFDDALVRLALAIVVYWSTSVCVQVLASLFLESIH